MNAAGPPTPSLTPPPARVGMVLAGGAARGAYEVGVVQYILEDVARALGRDVPIDVISGTSAGSLNSVMLAAHADKPTRPPGCPGGGATRPWAPAPPR